MVLEQPNCPDCGRPMELRTARKGRYADRQFYGCSGYPHCKTIVNIEAGTIPAAVMSRTSRKFWKDLSGVGFEKEVARLYRRQGFKVQGTPASGDEGVDLFLGKNGQTIVVQCKRHDSPVGPSVARDLYGAMMHFKADGAILVCTAGFTSGVFAFTRNKSMELVDLKDLISMAQAFDSSAPRSSNPFCPSCGSKMSLSQRRSGKKKRGITLRFWRCSRFPKCHGTREVTPVTRGI